MKILDYVKEYFLKEADDLLKKNLSKIILEWSKRILDQTENTQPAIFLVSYSIFKVIEKETKFKIKKCKIFCWTFFRRIFSTYVVLIQLILIKQLNLLKHRGKAMQNAVPNG